MQPGWARVVVGLRSAGGWVGVVLRSGWARVVVGLRSGNGRLAVGLGSCCGLVELGLWSGCVRVTVGLRLGWGRVAFGLGSPCGRVAFGLGSCFGLVGLVLWSGCRLGVARCAKFGLKLGSGCWCHAGSWRRGWRSQPLPIASRTSAWARCGPTGFATGTPSATYPEALFTYPSGGPRASIYVRFRVVYVLEKCGPGPRRRCFGHFTYRSAPSGQPACPHCAPPRLRLRTRLPSKSQPVGT